MSAAARLIKRGDGGEAALGLSAAGATAARVLGSVASTPAAGFGCQPFRERASSSASPNSGDS